VKASPRTAVLIGEDIACDRRVLTSLAEYPVPEVVDVVKEAAAATGFSFHAYWRAAGALFSALLRGRRLWSLLGRQYGLGSQEIAGGLSVSLRSFVRAQQGARRLRGRLESVRLIHAHDLFCGVVGLELSKRSGAALVYDAHEIEFHRNRRNSWLRTAFDAAVERSVISGACEVRVVNEPIAGLYARIHDVPPGRLRVVLNDHFVQCWQKGSIAEPARDALAVVYVGGGVRGRQLERLAAEANRFRIPVHAFFIGEVPEVARAGGWMLGARDYEGELRSLVAACRCVMWCCVDDVCLSYRLALPNKFFQALAVGIPVVAAADTYLAEVVQAYDLGFTYDGRNFAAIVDGLRSPGFADLVGSVRRFRLALSAGSVRI
jgi:glycosyltransferase involved in cell wall biosynthesis